MFTWVDNTMYIVKDDVGTVIAVFDTEKKANKFAKKNKNYYVDEAVKYDYKDFYYKEVQAVTVRVVATRFDVNISVIKIRKILYEQKGETSLFRICRSVTPCGSIPGTVQREGALSLSGTKRSKL